MVKPQTKDAISVAVEECDASKLNIDMMPVSKKN